MRSGRAHPLSEKVVAKALRKYKGNQTIAANALGVTRQAIVYWCRKSEVCKAICEEAIEEVLDIAEGKLALAVSRGEPWAITFVLKTRGKQRGYQTSASALININAPPDANERAQLMALPVERLEQMAQWMAEAQPPGPPTIDAVAIEHVPTPEPDDDPDGTGGEEP